MQENNIPQENNDFNQPQANAQVPPLPTYHYNVASEEQPFAQSGYTYQNPNPYQSTYTAPPKKKKNRGLIITAVCAAAVMLVCCTAVVTALVMEWQGYGASSDGMMNPFGDQEDFAPSNQIPDDVGRDEDAIYELPDMTAEQKEGDELSLVEINKKVKGSVVAVLIAESKEGQAEFSGSGFIISEDGYIITNTHVVEDASSIKIVLHDGITEYQATIVGADERSDLAVLKVDAKNLTPVDLGDSTLLEVGETVVAIGNP